MSIRNLVWLAVIVAVVVVGWITIGWLAGVLGGVLALIVSEVVERRARAARGGSRPSVFRR